MKFGTSLFCNKLDPVKVEKLVFQLPQGQLFIFWMLNNFIFYGDFVRLNLNNKACASINVVFMYLIISLNLLKNARATMMLQSMGFPLWFQKSKSIN